MSNDFCEEMDFYYESGLEGDDIILSFPSITSIILAVPLI